MSRLGDPLPVTFTVGIADLLAVVTESTLVRPVERLPEVAPHVFPGVVPVAPAQMRPGQVQERGNLVVRQRRSRELGLGVGISSGANFIGALKLARELGPNSVVATIFCDSSKKYLSTDFCREEPVREGFYGHRVEFGGTRVIAETR